MGKITLPFRWVWIFFLKQLPSVQTHDRRWALFSIVLSIAFFLLGSTFAVLTIDSWGSRGEDMGILAIVLAVLGCIALIYAIGLSIYWYYHSEKKDKDFGKINREIIEELKRIRGAKNERSKNTKQGDNL